MRVDSNQCSARAIVAERALMDDSPLADLIRRALAVFILCAALAVTVAWISLLGWLVYRAVLMLVG